MDWYTGTPVYWYNSIPVHRHAGIGLGLGEAAFRYTGIRVDQQTGIPVYWHNGAPVYQSRADWYTGMAEY